MCRRPVGPWLGPWIGMAVVALATSLAGPVGAPAAAADATDESVLDDLGAGWRTFSCGVAASPGQLEPRCFIDDEAGATVTISGIAVPKGIDPRGVMVGLAGDAPASALIDTRGLDAARGFTITDDANTLEKVALVAAGRDRVFTITFLGPPESFPDTVGLVLDVARGLQAGAGGAPPRPTPPTRAQRAVDRLFAPPPAGFTTTQLDAPSDLESLRTVARSQKVIDVLENDVVHADTGIRRNERADRHLTRPHAVRRVRGDRTRRREPRAASGPPRRTRRPGARRGRGRRLRERIPRRHDRVPAGPVRRDRGHRRRQHDRPGADRRRRDRDRRGAGGAAARGRDRALLLPVERGCGAGGGRVHDRGVPARGRVRSPPCPPPAAQCRCPRRNARTA